MLTKWNKENSLVLINTEGWHNWLLDIIFETTKDTGIGLTIIDIGMRLHTIILQHSMLCDDDGYKHIKDLIAWLEYKIMDSKHSARALVVELLEKLMEALLKDSNERGVALETYLWKNLVCAVFCIEELMLYMRHDPLELPKFNEAKEGWL